MFLAVAGLGVGPAQATTFCVLVPHFKDEYWLGVGYGLEQEAARRGIELHIHEAGGYLARAAQIAQIEDCLGHEVDAILLGPVSADHPDMLAAVHYATRTTPVLALVNGLKSSDVAGTIGVSQREMGASVGRYLSQVFPARGPDAKPGPVTAVLVSGPPESGWARPLELGLRDELVNSGVTIVASYGGDTGLPEQLDLVQRALREHPQIDVLIGSAPAIEAAMGLLRAQDAAGSRQARPMLISTYLTHSIKRGLIGGQVAFAPFDDPQQQGRLAISAAVWFLNSKRPIGMIGPTIKGVTAAEAATQNLALSPPDYFPKID